MRARVRKRKIVPITATVQIKQPENKSQTIDAANAVKSQLYQSIGRRVFDFCEIEYDFSKTCPGFVTTKARVMVVDSGGKRVRRKC